MVARKKERIRKMATTKADIDDLAEIIAESLNEYGKKITEIAEEEIEKTAKEVLDSLKKNPDIPTRTGEYKKGFRLKKVAEGKGYRRIKIYNKKYQLTHLLEKGHKTTNGKRTKVFPHWEQAQEIADNLPENIRKRIE